jgi:hypothetical protein
MIPMAAGTVFAMSNVAAAATVATHPASNISPSYTCVYLPRADTVCCYYPTGTVCYVS